MGNGPALAGPLTFPNGWVAVPGNGTFGTSNFYVMQYDAKCIQTSNNTPLTAPDTGYHTYSNSGQPCTGSNYYVASAQSGYPIANIDHNDALAYCTALGAHLLTNDEYMTIVTNAANVSSNWSGGSVGSGYMPRGNSNSSYAQSDNNQYGLGYSDFTHLRTLTLSNGSIVWDMAGNVWEHVQRSSMNSGDNTATITTPSCSSGSGWQWCQYGTSLTPYITAYNDSSFSAATVGPPNSSWNTNQNMGEVYTDSGATGGSVFLRGGVWSSGTIGGPFSLYLNWGPTDTYYNVGFRCAR